jgi:hypothetical protein|tara:strand:- start:1109 stop:1321 length:213 start_codon:yes stop_codon:yes gene_type:complete
MNNGYYIDDKYRTNSKSLVPGGWDVEVEYKTLEKRIYSNIKNTEAYAKHILANNENVKSVTVLKESNNEQ